MGAGRQRTFDKEDALVKAMEVFWQKGFSGTSLSDLTEAMGINKPSLYAAFGNKEELFVSALNRYVNAHGAPHFDKLLNPKSSFPKRMRAYLESIAEMLSDTKLPGGCFVTTSTCEAGSNCLPEEAIQTILKINATSIDAFINFFKDEKAKGNLPSKASPEVFADYLLTLQFGLAVMARNGIKRDRLNLVIGHAVSSFIK
ncbi:MAG: TetR family transcriptional regulator [Gammaproteobacteria bacterium SG8_15]|nr:MAG: TetR family transcriptional regulator [Gammaproteobacteria bacterium SG8_15]